MGPAHSLPFAGQFLTSSTGFPRNQTARTQKSSSTISKLASLPTSTEPTRLSSRRALAGFVEAHLNATRMSAPVIFMKLTHALFSVNRLPDNWPRSLKLMSVASRQRSQAPEGAFACL